MARNVSDSRGCFEGPTVDIDDVTDQQLVKSLGADICPICGRLKHRAQTLCRRDYAALPHGKRMALYDRLGEGYREAVAEAFAERGANRFILPA